MIPGNRGSTLAVRGSTTTLLYDVDRLRAALVIQICRLLARTIPLIALDVEHVEPTDRVSENNDTFTRHLTVRSRC